MLYIMRHGETDWNAARRLQGRTDVPLNAAGRKMAERAAEECGGIHLDVIYCSPLSRARETAVIVAGSRTPVIVDERLTEMSFGVCEGTEDSFPAKGGPMLLFFNDPPAYIPPEGGESFSELFARTGEFLREVAFPLTEQGKDVLIVGHGAMNLSIICRIKNIPLKDFWSFGIPNCKLIRLL